MFEEHCQVVHKIGKQAECYCYDCSGKAKVMPNHLIRAYSSEQWLLHLHQRLIVIPMENVETMEKSQPRDSESIHFPLMRLNILNGDCQGPDLLIAPRCAIMSTTSAPKFFLKQEADREEL